MTSSLSADNLLLPGTMRTLDDVIGDGSDSADALVMREMLEEFRSQMLKTSDPKSAVLIGFYIPLFICSVIGNIFVLAIVLPFRKMRNMTHCFIVNLAVSDLLR